MFPSMYVDFSWCTKGFDWAEVSLCRHFVSSVVLVQGLAFCSEAMASERSAAVVGTTGCAAAAAPPSPTTPTAVAADGGSGSVEGLATTPLRTKARGRPSQRPKIDIDQEVEEANRLADLFKRMQHASKVAARTAIKSKQRLMKKANKLSEMDLMRLAVLKRCGFMEQAETGSVDAGTSPSAAAASAAMTPSTAVSAMGKKLQGMVSTIPGASDLMKALEASATSSCSAAAASSSSSGARRASCAQLPRQAVGLKRLPSCPAVGPSRRSKVPLCEVPEQPSLAELVEPAGDDEGAPGASDVEE